MSAKKLCYRKKPLPALTPQDLRVVFGSSKEEESPTCSVLVNIPMAYDILCPEGKKEIEKQYPNFMEQSDIVTIKMDTLAQPSKFQSSPQKQNHFELIDRKVREIEKFAAEMDKDFDELGVPKPTDYPHPAPLFSDEFVPSVVQPEGHNKDSARASLQFGRHSLNKSSSIDANKALDSIDKLQDQLRSAAPFRSANKLKKVASRTDVAPTEWKKVSDLVQEDGL